MNNIHRLTSSMAAGGLLAIVAALAAGKPDAAPAKSPMQVTTGKSAVTIRANGSDLLTYRYGDVPFKPYVQQFLSPKGVGILRDAPHDHLHHHALMFAVAVDGVDFWAEKKTAGRQVHRSFTDVRKDRPDEKLLAGFTELLDWTSPQPQRVLLTERRTIEIYARGSIGASLVTWQSRLELPPGKKTAKITGSHYFGLGMRFLKSMDTGGRFENATGKAGKVVRGTERLAPATWCAYFAKADGNAVTVAMFDHPDNPRHPATWFTMTKPFAYLSATMALKKPLTLESPKPLVLRYGVAVWDGHVHRDRIEKAYKQWSARPGPAAGDEQKVHE